LRTSASAPAVWSHDLDQQREELRGLRETHPAMDRFLLGYRRYAATGARRLAGDVPSSPAELVGEVADCMRLKVLTGSRETHRPNAFAPNERRTERL
jgi:hypothetical protein